MSICEGWKEAKQELKPFFPNMLRLTGLVFSGQFLELVSESSLERKSLPEPFDIASHIGNFREAAIGTVGVYAIVGILALFEKPREVFKRNAQRTAVAAFAVSSAIQVIGEKYEISNAAIGTNTGDPLDAAYGIAWSAVTAYGTYRTVMNFEQSLYDQAHEQQTPESFHLNSAPENE